MDNINVKDLIFKNDDFPYVTQNKSNIIYNESFTVKDVIETINKVDEMHNMLSTLVHTEKDDNNNDNNIDMSSPDYWEATVCGHNNIKPQVVHINHNGDVELTYVLSLDSIEGISNREMNLSIDDNTHAIIESPVITERLDRFGLFIIKYVITRDEISMMNGNGEDATETLFDYVINIDNIGKCSPDNIHVDKDSHTVHCDYVFTDYMLRQSGIYTYLDSSQYTTDYQGRPQHPIKVTKEPTPYNPYGKIRITFEFIK